MNTIKQCFKVILQGNKDRSKQAARQVRKLLYSSSGIGKYEEIAELIKKSPVEYKKISEDFRQENFVIAVSVIYFLHGKEDKPDFLFPWLLELLLHSNGHIRYASVRMLSIELGPLTAYIRIPDFEPISSVNFKPEQADIILFSLFINLNQLLRDEFESKYKKYKFVSSLPASPYKSIQMVMAAMEDLCGQKYFAKFAF